MTVARHTDRDIDKQKHRWSWGRDPKGTEEDKSHYRETDIGIDS